MFTTKIEEKIVKIFNFTIQRGKIILGIRCQGKLFFFTNYDSYEYVFCYYFYIKLSIVINKWLAVC